MKSKHVFGYGSLLRNVVNSCKKASKGQMFIVTMVFLTGLIFAVQQLLFQYSSLDLSRPLQRTDYYLLVSMEDIFNLTMSGLNCSSPASEAEVTQNLMELSNWLSKQTFKGYSLDLSYNGKDSPNIRCDPLNPRKPVLDLEITITGADSHTQNTYSFYALY